MNAFARGGSARRRLGTLLVVLGLVTIVVSVLHVANAVQGNRPRRAFAERVGYDEAKQSLHRSFPAAFATGLAGLALAFLGTRLRRT